MYRLRLSNMSGKGHRHQVSWSHSSSPSNGNYNAPPPQSQPFPMYQTVNPADLVKRPTANYPVHSTFAHSGNTTGGFGSGGMSGTIPVSRMLSEQSNVMACAIARHAMEAHYTLPQTALMSQVSVPGPGPPSMQNSSLSPDVALSVTPAEYASLRDALRERGRSLTTSSPAQHPSRVQKAIQRSDQRPVAGGRYDRSARMRPKAFLTLLMWVDNKRYKKFYNFCTAGVTTLYFVGSNGAPGGEEQARGQTVSALKETMIDDGVRTWEIMWSKSFKEVERKFPPLQDPVWKQLHYSEGSHYFSKTSPVRQGWLLRCKQEISL